MGVDYNIDIFMYIGTAAAHQIRSLGSDATDDDANSIYAREAFSWLHAYHNIQ